jgi:hypothetical protein
MWSKKHEQCIECGKTEREHHGNGLCILCYERLRGVRRRKNPKYIIKHRQDNKKHSKKRYWDVIKKYTPEQYRDYLDKQNIRNNTYKSKLDIHSINRMKNISNETRRYKRFIEGRSIKEKAGISIVCDGCDKHCRVVTPIIDVNNELEKLKRFKKLVIKMCKK